jgi:uncharacterized protein (DUF433 family)/uncharacterized protein YjiS (DUF1127 family)
MVAKIITMMVKDFERTGSTALGVREVAALSGTTVAAVNRCIDRRVIVGVRRARNGRRLPPYAASFMALKNELDALGVSQQASRRLCRALSRLSDDELPATDIALSHAFRVNTAAVADVAERTQRYLASRNRWITADPQIKGGVPVIRGTRIGVYSVQQRLDGGETIQELVEDHPEVPREAFEAAALYARTHPRRGRPPRIGRPATA